MLTWKEETSVGLNITTYTAETLVGQAIIMKKKDGFKEGDWQIMLPDSTFHYCNDNVSLDEVKEAVRRIYKKMLLKELKSI